jgi:hypothetical protein
MNMPFRLSHQILCALSLIGTVNVSSPAVAQQPQPATGPYRSEEIKAACKLAITDHTPPSPSEAAYMVFMAEGVCMGAISTTMRFAPQMNERFKFCPPASATPEQFVPLILQFIEGNPQVLPFDIRDVANYVGRQQWPCGTASAPQRP